MKNFTLCAFADEADPKVCGQIAALKENGIPCLEVRGVNSQSIQLLNLDQAKDLRCRLDDAGIQVWSLGSPIGKIKLEDDFEAHLDTLRHTLELGDILGAQKLRMFSFYLPADRNPRDFRSEVIDRMGRMMEIIDRSSIQACHENEKGIYGSMADTCLDLLQTFPTLRAVFDPANFIQCGQPTLPAWEMLHTYVEYMHVKDALSNGSVVPAGCGEGHVPEILRMYGEQGGKVLTLEPHLKVFKGLSGLEREGEESKVGQYFYGSSREAFDAAVAALKKIIGEEQ